jgi:hypothetical protein
MDLSHAWWEDVGQTHMVRPGFNATAFIFQMKNRFRDDYRGVQHGEHKHTLVPEPVSAVDAWVEEMLKGKASEPAAPPMSH